MSLSLPILNTAIVTNEGVFAMERMTLDEAKSLVAAHDSIDSAVGHESTAAILSALLGVHVPVDRSLFSHSVGQTALVFKLRGRPEPGRELSGEEIEEIGYDFFALTRVAPDTSAL